MRNIWHELLLWAVACLLLAAAVLVITGCTMDRDNHRNATDCYMESPDGWLLVCGDHGTNKSDEGELLSPGAL
jgi:hypothetical protein